jgi:hypothetical protein
MAEGTALKNTKVGDCLPCGGNCAPNSSKSDLEWTDAAV